MDEFFAELKACAEREELSEFCRRKLLHGTPHVFAEREDDFYHFRERIAQHFSIHYNDIVITGSAKLGFSPFKRKKFDLDSDIDVAIVSLELFDNHLDRIADYQYELRESRKTVSEQELSKYHNFLEYVALGWIRPDLIPDSFRLDIFRQEWFDFFRSISYGESEVGNYKVSAGIFKSPPHLERYQRSGMEKIARSLMVGR